MKREFAIHAVILLAGMVLGYTGTSFVHKLLLKKETKELTEQFEEETPDVCSLCNHLIKGGSDEGK